MASHLRIDQMCGNPFADRRLGEKVESRSRIIAKSQKQT
jgi:hypothetical protein